MQPQFANAGAGRRTTIPPRHGKASRGHAAWQRGVDLRTAGRIEAARDSFRLAARLVPDDPLYWINLARCEQQLGQAGAALAHAERAFALDRRNPLACHLLANMHCTAHRSTLALRALDALESGVERDASWHVLRGAALLGARQPEDAVQSLLAALPLTADDRALRRRALTLLGNSFGMLSRHFEGSVCFRMVLDLDPAALGHALTAAHYGTHACDWAQFDSDIARLDECIAAARERPAEASLEALAVFSALNLCDDPELLRWLAELVWADRGASLDESSLAPRPHAARWTERVPRPGGRIRLGLLSGDFFHHATSMLLVEALESIDRDRFELWYYSNSPDDQSPLRARVLAPATRVHEVGQWPDEEIAAQIRRDEIGVLFDLKGFTFASRTGALASRPAPLQVAWLGYPGSCGAAFVDYLIGDPVVTPLEAQPYYTECIAQMPHCYQPNDSRRIRPATVARAACGLPEQGFVFACFNQSYKILPPVFAAWCLILRQCPGSVLWLLVRDDATRERLCAAAAQHGVAAERLVFAPFAEIDAHRARLPNADLFLDTYPCGAHTTASDALWGGVPVLALAGDSFASRVAASLLTTLGVPELVCTSLEDYVERALQLARDPHALMALRARIERGRTASPLFDGRRFARDFERLVRRMVERHDAGLAPGPLAAHPTPAQVESTGTPCPAVTT